jgi:hypothetical protein
LVEDHLESSEGGGDDDDDVFFARRGMIRSACMMRRLDRKEGVPDTAGVLYIVRKDKAIGHQTYIKGAW